MFIYPLVKIHRILNVCGCVRWASCRPKRATYNPRGFGALCGIVGKAATVTSGDCVWLLVTEAHGVHRLASAADDPLQRETRRYCQWIRSDTTWKRNTLTRSEQHVTTYMWVYTKSKFIQFPNWSTMHKFAYFFANIVNGIDGSTELYLSISTLCYAILPLHYVVLFSPLHLSDIFRY